MSGLLFRQKEIIGYPLDECRLGRLRSAPPHSNNGKKTSAQVHVDKPRVKRDHVPAALSIIGLVRFRIRGDVQGVCHWLWGALGCVEGSANDKRIRCFITTNI